MVFNSSYSKCIETAYDFFNRFDWCGPVLPVRPVCLACFDRLSVLCCTRQLSSCVREVTYSSSTGRSVVLSVCDAFFSDRRKDKPDWIWMIQSTIAHASSPLQARRGNDPWISHFSSSKPFRHSFYSSVTINRKKTLFLFCRMNSSCSTRGPLHSQPFIGSSSRYKTQWDHRSWIHTMSLLFLLSLTCIPHVSAQGIRYLSDNSTISSNSTNTTLAWNITNSTNSNNTQTNSTGGTKSNNPFISEIAGPLLLVTTILFFLSILYVLVCLCLIRCGSVRFDPVHYPDGRIYFCLGVRFLSSWCYLPLCGGGSGGGGAT